MVDETELNFQVAPIEIKLTNNNIEPFNLKDNILTPYFYRTPPNFKDHQKYPLYPIFSNS
jgi:hypothetical protein